MVLSLSMEISHFTNSFPVMQFFSSRSLDFPIIVLTSGREFKRKGSGIKKEKYSCIRQKGFLPNQLLHSADALRKCQRHEIKMGCRQFYLILHIYTYTHARTRMHASKKKQHRPIYNKPQQPSPPQK